MSSNLNRRSFLAASAAVAAGLTVAGRTNGAEAKTAYRKALIGDPTEGTLAAWKAAGFHGMECGGWGAPPDAAGKGRELAEKAGMRLHSVLRGWVNFNQPDRVAADSESVKTALAATQAYGGDALLLVPCKVGGVAMPEPWEFDIEFDESTGHVTRVAKGDNGPYEAYIKAQNEATDASRRAIEPLISTAEKTGVIIALENVWNNLWVQPALFANFIASFQSPWVQCYFDIGNHVKYAPAEEWIRALGKLVVRCHVKDFKLNNDGHGGNFCDICDGSVNWPAVMQELDKLGKEEMWMTIEGSGGLSLDERSRRLDDIIAGSNRQPTSMRSSTAVCRIQHLDLSREEEGYVREARSHDRCRVLAGVFRCRGAGGGRTGQGDPRRPDRAGHLPRDCLHGHPQPCQRGGGAGRSRGGGRFSRRHSRQPFELRAGRKIHRAVARPGHHDLRHDRGDAAARGRGAVGERRRPPPSRAGPAGDCRGQALVHRQAAGRVAGRRHQDLRPGQSGEGAGFLQFRLSLRPRLPGGPQLRNVPIRPREGVPGVQRDVDRTAPPGPVLVRDSRRRGPVHDHGDGVRNGHPRIPDEGGRDLVRRTKGHVRGRDGYGTEVVGEKASGSAGGLGGYEPLVLEIATFFKTGKPPVSMEETLEIYTFMEAADESKRRGGQAVTMAEVLDKARRAAAEMP